MGQGAACGRSIVQESAVDVEPRAATCPNCGAPLRLDASGSCAYCRAVVHDFDAGASLPNLVRVILKTLSTLGEESAVQRALEKSGLTGVVDSLNPAAIAAGCRVRDAGLIVEGVGTDIHAFQPAELWTFNLAADLIAVMVAADNLSKVKRVSFAETLRGIDASLSSHWAKSMIGNAAPGPDELRACREAVPRRRLTKF